MQGRFSTSKDRGYTPGKLLGYVQLHVGSRVFALPVQSVHFASGVDSAAAGGLFEDSGQLGILVDGDATPSDVTAQIERASVDAVRELSRRYLN